MRIEKICQPWAISKTIPAAFDESVSYLEMLMGILKKQNELISQVNQNTEKIDGFDNQYNELRRDMDSLIQNVEAFKRDIQNDVDNKINTRYQQIASELNVRFNQLASQLSNQISAVREELQEEIYRIELGQIFIINPGTGQRDDLQSIINQIYDRGRDKALTASEYDALELTASAYDAYALTAFEYDNNGKELLV